MSRLSSVRIDVAPNFLAACPDEVVLATATPTRAIERQVAEPGDAGEEMAKVFRSVFSSQVGGQPRKAEARQEKVGQKISWSEYVEFVAGMDGAADLSAEGAGVSDANESVRSGDWLRHSAALSLNRLGRALQAAAIVLTASEGQSAGELAE